MSRIDKSPSQSPFKGRDKELGEILTGKVAHLLNIHGVAGIGKTRLIGEAAQRLLAQKTNAVLIQLDLQDLPPVSADRPKALLRALLDQESQRLKKEYAQPSIRVLGWRKVAYGRHNVEPADAPGRNRDCGKGE